MEEFTNKSFSECNSCRINNSFRTFFLDNKIFVILTFQSYVLFGSLNHCSSEKFSNIFYLWSSFTDIFNTEVPLIKGGYFQPPFPDLVLKVQHTTSNTLYEVDFLRFLLNIRDSVKPNNYRIGFPKLFGTCILHNDMNIDCEIVRCNNNDAMITLLGSKYDSKTDIMGILMTFQGVPLKCIRDLQGVHKNVCTSPFVFEEQYNQLKIIIDGESNGKFNLTDRHIGNFLVWP